MSMRDGYWSPARSGETDPPRADTLVVDGSTAGRVALGLIGAISGGQM